MTKVFVSGCFDLLHCGHIAFLEEASKFGDLYVSVGSDKTIEGLKKRTPVYNENERLYIIQSLKFVKEAFIARGSGKIDFKEEILSLNPDIFIVNEDGDSKEKRQLCQDLNIEYIVLKRIPKGELPPRSSTSLKMQSSIPYRIDLAGGWLDQPLISQHFPGPVLTISLEPNLSFNLRSGMATSTREKAKELWGNRIPNGDPINLAKILFAYDNSPGKKETSGSQDSLGIVMPGLNYLYYNCEYWPEKIESVNDDEILDWIESVVYMVPLSPRVKDYDVFNGFSVDAQKAKELSLAAEDCFKAILEKNIKSFGDAVTRSFNAQCKIFPSMINEEIKESLTRHQLDAEGWKVSGAGGGGYLILISSKPIEGALRIKIRRKLD